MLDAQYPIDPSTDEHGRIRALIPILGPEGSMPVALPALDGSWDVDVNARVASTSTYAKLGASAMVSADTTLDRKTSVWDALVGKNAVAASPDVAKSQKGVIYQTFWGIGLRIAITFRSTEIEASASIASIAANAEYRKVDVQYEIQSIGLGPLELADVLSTIPPLGQFDMNAYSTLESARAKLTVSLQARLAASDAPAGMLQPAIVSLASVSFADELSEAAEYRFTMQSIASGQSLTDALARLGGEVWKAVRPEQVKAIYREVVGDAKAPGDKAKDTARAWLDTTG